MKRGQIYLTGGKGDFSGKPRPALVVQSDLFNEHHPTVSVCPITSEVTGDYLQRVAIDATEHTGLLERSEIQIDKLQVIKRARFGKKIGQAPEEVMVIVDDTLRLWLDL